MRIFSNFDTQLGTTLYLQEVEKFGKDKVILIHRDPIYLWLKIVVPAIIGLALLTLSIYIEYHFVSQGANIVIINLGVAGIGILTLSGLWYTIGKLIDYYMDFAILSPKALVSYEQEGIFKRSSISLDLSNLRSINEEKSGLLKSIFNYGTIVFLSEGDRLLPDQKDEIGLDKGVIRLNYISQPRHLREKILRIIKE